MQKLKWCFGLRPKFGLRPNLIAAVWSCVWMTFRESLHDNGTARSSSDFLIAVPTPSPVKYQPELCWLENLSDQLVAFPASIVTPHHKSVVTVLMCVFVPPLPPPGHLWDVMLVCRKGNIEKLSLYYSIVYYYNGARRYEQFLQVGRLDRALILLGLTPRLQSASVSSVFMVLYIYTLCFKKKFTPRTFMITVWNVNQFQ